VTAMPAGAPESVLIFDDGQAPYVLPVVRAFGRAGWRVGLGSDSEGQAGRSRWVTARHRVPAPERGLEAFAEAALRAAREGGYAVAFGADDVELLALSSLRETLPCAVPYAPHESVLRSVDKLALAHAAARVGLAGPATVAATAATVAATNLPVIVKSRLHWTPGSTADVRHLLVRVCRDRAEVAGRVAEIAACGGEAILQQHIDGQLIAVSAVVDAEGRVVAWSQQQTLRSSLRRTSARAETVPLDPVLTGRVADLLTDLGWFGLANLQFLRPPGGQPHLIDFNGRIYGSIALAIAAGANLPVLWAQLALGQRPTEPIVARPGVRFQELESDLRRARVERRAGILDDVLDTVAYAPRAAHGCLSVTDPWPAAYRLGQLFQGAVNGRFGRSRPR